MNVALPALIVFLLLLPVFIARSRVKHAERISLDYSPFGQVATEAVIWAMALHLCGVLAVQCLTPYQFKPELVLRLFSTDPLLQAKALDGVAAQTDLITHYFGWLLVISYLGPTAVRALIQHQRLDRYNAPLQRLLRFTGAPWYYLLSGADFQKNEAPDCVSISAVVNVSGEPYLYTGILDEYFLTQEGDLDRLILQQVMRRPFAKDKVDDGTPTEATRFYSIDGDYFVLRYSEAITLNVEYIQLATEDAKASEEYSAP